MIPDKPIDNLDDAKREIERLRTQLANAEIERDYYQGDLNRVLPPLPPELEYLNGDLAEILKDSIPFDQAFLDSLSDEAS